MKTLSTALTNFLAANTSFLMAEFYTITLVDGTVLAYSNADVSLSYIVGANLPGVTQPTVFNPLGGMKLTRDRMRMIVGTQVDSLDITFFPETTDLINGQLFTYEVSQGILDGAWVSVDRAFLTSWTSAGIVGTVNVFSGLVSDATVGRTSVKLTVKSPLELLNVNMPRNVYQPGCIHNLFDAGCTLSAAAFQVTGACVGTQFPGNIRTNLTQAAGYFTMGYLTFTSGVLAGQARGILGTNSTGGVALNYPFPSAPTAGDTFNVLPGCDHQQSTCTNKFSNVIHFRGFPYIPVPETAI